VALLQVTGYVSPLEREVFEAYATSFDLDVGTLMLLLIVRELQLARLALLRERFDTPEMPERTKVTAHAKSAAVKAGIIETARRASLSTSRVCAVLLRAELEERWLERALKA
jgi:hypothetical protein